MKTRIKALSSRIVYLVGLLICLCANTAFGGAVAGYTKYYVPGDEESMLRIFRQFGGAADTTMHSIITITAWTGNTTLYYDHWEDGYDLDPLNPAPTTEVVTLVPRGAYHVFESSSIPAAPRNPAATYYDGRDYIYAVGGTTTMTRASWIEARGTVQSVAWEVYPVEPQLTTYILPFGEDLAAAGLTDFSRVFALIQGTKDGTTVTVDLNGDGTPDPLDQNRDGDCNDTVPPNDFDKSTVTLNRGEVFLLDDASGAGGYQGSLCPGYNLNKGTLIKGTETLQVQYIIGSTVYGLYETRSASSYPRGLWSDEYYAPVDGAPGGYDTDIYLHNPHTTSITINYQTTTGSGSFDIPAGDTVSFQAANPTGSYVPSGSGVYLKGSDIFWGVSSVDTESNTYEWGYPLVPSFLLDNEHFMGWSPSSYPITGGLYDSSGVFITPAQDNTFIFVDLDNDGNPDQTYTLDRLQSLFVYDNTDGDLAGAHIWGTGPYAMAFGQNSENANAAAPSIDLGYTALPGREFIDLVLKVTKTASPVIVPTAAGSTSTYTITVNSANFSVDDIIVTDTLPANWQYVADSAIITLADKTQITGAAANPDVNGQILSWWQATNLGDMAPNQEITIQFTGRTTAGFALGDVSLNHVEAVGIRTVAGVTQIFTTTDFAFNGYGDITVTKSSSGVDPLYPGDQFTYTVTVSNPSTTPLTNIAIYDPLPPGLAYVPGSSQVTFPGRNRFYSETFPARVYNNNADNSPPLLWTTDWDDNDDNSPTGDDVQIMTDIGDYSLRILDNDRYALRKANLSGYASALLTFDARRQSLDNASDWVEVRVCDNVAAGTTSTACSTGWQTVVRIAGGGTEGNYSGYSYDLAAILATPNSANFGIMFISSGSLGNNDAVFFDNIRITVEGTGTITNPAGSEPNFVDAAAGYFLQQNQSLTLTYDVVVDDPLASGIESLTNTAWVNTSEIPLPASAQVTNLVINPTSGSASVGNRVWLDTNGDGVQNVGEGGLANIQVVLKDQFGTPKATTVTDVNGYYLFTGIEPGPGYYLEVTGGLPTGLDQSAPVGHSDHRTDPFTLTAGQVYADANIGYIPSPGTGTFGNQVWSDADGDTIRDLGEPGLGGITVAIYLDNGDEVFDPVTDTLSGTTITAADGTYLFAGISATGTEDYFIFVDQTQAALSGYTPTTGTSLLNLDVNGGDTLLNNDFGFSPPAGSSFTIQDRIWYDATGSPGIAGVTVELLDASRNVIALATSDANGDFSFAGVAGNNNDYTLRIADAAGVLANYYGITPEAIAGEYDINNLSAPVSGAHFGYGLTATVGDSVFNDLDGDGAQDAGEPGIGGITVRLYTDGDGDGIIEAGDTVLSTLTTGAGGVYQFTGLADGNYIVSIDSPPAGYIFTGIDSDPGSAGHQRAVNVSGGNTSLGIDFGYAALVPRTIAGSLWNDKNEDGIIDTGEPGLAGVTVALMQGGSTIATTTSDASGNYSFADFASGVYTVAVTDTLGALSGYLPTYEADVFTIGPFDNMASADVSGSDLTDIHFGFYKPVPTLAVVSSFTAANDGGRMVLEWSTASELGTVGFYLQRLDPASGKYVTINKSLLPGLLHAPQGGTYRYVDTGVQPGKQTYKLVEVESSGARREFGPYTVTPAPIAPAAGVSALSLPRAGAVAIRTDAGGMTFNGYASTPHGASSLQNKSRAGKSKKAVLIKNVPPAAAATALKINIRSKGLYFLSAADIAVATGIAEKQIYKFIRTRQVQLTSQGTPVALVNANSGLTFYAEDIDSIYSDRNIYRMNFAANPQPKKTVPALKQTAPVVLLEPVADQTFLDTVHAESDVWPITGLIHDPEADFWTWDYIIADNGSRSFVVPSPNPAIDDTAQLTIHFRGATDTEAALDHHASIALNGHEVGETEWAGTKEHTLTLEIGQWMLKDGDNTVSITGTLPPGAPYSIFYIDSFDLAYHRYYRAVNNSLFCRGDGNNTVTVSGFDASDIHLYDISVPTQATELSDVFIDEADGAYRITFSPSSPDVKFLALTGSAMLTAADLQADMPSSLKKGENAADYLIIAPKALFLAAEQLAAFRQQQGLRTMVVDLEDIYDEFNFGIPSPHAIREFLRYAYTSWSSAPKYVLLAGNGTFDYKNLLGYGDNLLPPVMLGTEYGLFASDNYLADVLHDDGVPEMAIGRIPAANEEQFAAFVRKIIGYETSTPGAWAKQIVLLADDPDVGGDFPADSDQLYNLVPETYDRSRIYLSQHPLAETRQMIQDSINSGALLVNYIGHAGLDRLASEGMLISETGSLLANGSRLPVLAAMTCMAGRFDIPGYSTLGKELLFNANGGINALWSSSGFSYNTTAVHLNKYFLGNLFAPLDRQQILGDLVRSSLVQQYEFMTGYNEMLDLYTLLGDPAMRLH